MNLADARTDVLLALGRMNTLYQKPVFDEWVLVQVTSAQGAILSYEGPRADSYQKRFKSDIAPLQVEMTGKNMAVGSFEFAPNGVGAHFDACVRLGPASYLFCNNTTKSMTDIRKDPLWVAAQEPFLDLATKFRMDPLE